MVFNFDLGGHLFICRTLQSLGMDANEFSSNDPLFNYYVYALNEIGKEEGETNGMFDGFPAEQYADTIVLDLFNVEAITTSVPGIEKEAVLILSVWMRFYHYIHKVVTSCRDNGSDVDIMIASLDKAAALWIGRLQVYGDNTRGTMLYNLAERAGVNFGQDIGEVPVNTRILESLKVIKAAIASGVCSQGDGEGYKILYEEMLKIESQMNIPIVQNFIHYITTDAAAKLIELYAIAIFPQIISCDVTLVQYFFEELRKLATKPKEEVDLMLALSTMQRMFGCLGISCSQVGSHAGGSGCDDDEVNPIASIVGYTPTSDVRNVRVNLIG